MITFVTCAFTDCSDTGPEEEAAAEAASASLAWTVPILSVSTVKSSAASRFKMLFWYFNSSPVLFTLHNQLIAAMRKTVRSAKI